MLFPGSKNSKPLAKRSELSLSWKTFITHSSPYFRAWTRELCLLFWACCVPSQLCCLCSYFPSSSTFDKIFSRGHTNEFMETAPTPISSECPWHSYRVCHTLPWVMPLHPFPDFHSNLPTKQDYLAIPKHLKHSLKKTSPFFAPAIFSIQLPISCNS